MQPIEDLYQELGELIVARLPPDWTEAQVIAEISGKGKFDLVGSFKTTEGEQVQQFVLGPQISALFMDLQRRVSKPDSPRQTTISLDRSGDFKVELDY